MKKGQCPIFLELDLLCKRLVLAMISLICKFPGGMLNPKYRYIPYTMLITFSTLKTFMIFSNQLKYPQKMQSVTD